VELRCPANLLCGIVEGPASGRLEVKCRGKWCGHQKGTVVLHTFDLGTGEIVSTRKFSDPRDKFNFAHKEATL
jgi:hypothetical protein